MKRLTAIVAAALVLAGIGLAINSFLSGRERAPRYQVEGGHPEQGKRAVVKYGCGGCHVIAGIRSARGKVGPELTTMGERAYIAGNLPNSPPNLVRWIIDPQGVEPGTAMPNLGVTEGDARSIAAYLYSLR